MGFALSPVTAKRPNFCPPAVYFWSLAFPFFGCALSRPPPLPAREIFAAGTHATADGTYEDNAPPQCGLKLEVRNGVERMLDDGRHKLVSNLAVGKLRMGETS